MKDLGDKVGMSHTAISRRESGSFKRWGKGERRTFAEAFDMTVDEFDAKWRDQKINQTKGGNGIPVINRAPAGKAIDYEEYSVDSGQGFEYIDQGDLSGDNLFAVIVNGDSMEPTLSHGDYLVLEPLNREFSGMGSREFRDGGVCFVRFDPLFMDGGCAIARAHSLPGGNFLLTKDNSKHPSISARRDQIQQMGVAIERRTKVGL